MPILLSLASAVVYGVGDWFGGRAARRQSAIVVAGVGQVVSLILVFVGVLIIGSPVPSAATWV